MLVVSAIGLASIQYLKSTKPPAINQGESSETITNDEELVFYTLTRPGMKTDTKPTNTESEPVKVLPSCSVDPECEIGSQTSALEPSKATETQSETSDKAQPIADTLKNQTEDNLEKLINNDTAINGKKDEILDLIDELANMQEIAKI